MKSFIALLSFIAAVAAAPGTGMGFGGTDAVNMGGTGTSTSVDGMGGMGDMGGMGGSSMGMGSMGPSNGDTSGNDNGSDDDMYGGSDDGSSDDSSEDNSGGNGAGGNGLSNLGSMTASQKTGVSFGIIFAIGAVVAAAGVGYFIYRKRQNGAQMLSNQ